MLEDSNWKFINDPSSEAFRLWKNAAHYYAGKQNIKSEYYSKLLEEARELTQMLQQLQ